MFEKMTDLALESHEIRAERGEDDGVELRDYMRYGCNITDAVVKSGEGERLAGKPAGRYITVELDRLWQNDKNALERSVKAVADELKPLLPEGEGCVLAVGLGNEDITPDSVGPRAVRSLIVTRHLKGMAPDLYRGAGFSSLAALSPGVLGKTGIESADIIRGVCDEIKPKCVVIIDALASRRLSRLASTVQISDGGICPGSGVFNRRMKIDRDTLGVKVVSVGVPTVVDAATLAYDLLEEAFGKDKQGLEPAKKLAQGRGKDLFVAPKDSDSMARDVAKLVAGAINIAVHGLDIESMNEYSS
ncbi:MAG: GPR endopeptidase [Clostridia bacterium]|nr:GPR endopeptidase [Clostridia bacterium]